LSKSHAFERFNALTVFLIHLISFASGAYFEIAMEFARLRKRSEPKRRKADDSYRKIRKEQSIQNELKS